MGQGIQEIHLTCNRQDTFKGISRLEGEIISETSTPSHFIVIGLCIYTLKRHENCLLRELNSRPLVYLSFALHLVPIYDTSALPLS